MVQFIRAAPSKRDESIGILSQALGEGLGNFTTSYLANKALDNVLNDKMLASAPLSERQSSLQRALQPYGKQGENILQQRMQVEAQREQEQQQKKQQQIMQKKAPVVAKALRNEKLTPEEDALLSPEEHVAIAKHKQMANKPVGGLSGQPVPPEIAQQIPQILNANKDASSDELAVAFDKAGIPRTFSNSYIENRRRAEESKQKLPNLKAELGVKRDAEILADADKFRALQPTEEASLNAMEDAITTGDQSFFSWDNLAEQTGFEWARSAKGGQFKTGAKTFLINNVSKFGARPNQYIEQQISDSLAKVGRDAEANLASLALTRFDSDVKKKYMEIIDELDESGDYAPGSLGREAQKRMKPIVEQMQTELSNKLSILSSQGGMNPGDVYLYDKDGLIVGTINQEDAKDLPEGYYVK